MIQSAGDEKLEEIEVEVQAQIHGREAKLIWSMVAVKILTDQIHGLEAKLIWSLVTVKLLTDQTYWIQKHPDLTIAV